MTGTDSGGAVSAPGLPVWLMGPSDVCTLDSGLFAFRACLLSGSVPFPGLPKNATGLGAQVPSQSGDQRSDQATLCGSGEALAVSSTF